MKKEESNLNDDIRNKIEEGINNWGVTNYSNLIKYRLIRDDIESKIITDSIFNVIYLDGFKSSIKTINSGCAVPNEVQLFSFLLSISSIEDLKNLFLYKDDYLELCLMSSYEFKNMPALGKINSIKSLSKFDNYNLSKVSSFHQYDLDKYDKVLYPEYIYKLYLNYRKYLEKNDIFYTRESLVRMISGTIMDISKNKYEEMRILIKNIVEELFNNIDTLDDRLSDDTKRLAKLFKDKYLDNRESFVIGNSINESILQSTLEVYTSIKDNNDKPKRLKKDLNE